MTRNLRGFVATASLSCLLGASAAAQSPAPMTTITSKMTNVAGDLSKAETGKPVQEQQETIVRDLDEWIALLEKECQGCKNGRKKNNPSRPAQASNISSGTGGIGTLDNPGESAKDWAKLSERERDRILQSMSEGFPPEYRTVLERYYRRLAEEKTVPIGGENAKVPVETPAAEKP
ncbi:hypothetical protein P12x_002023 [Tundrisphaera lichenicola]|uniref:hypothetical protein n=1 Tax=Tundrisphaera lichenicola TaxID=2029860 RepID=UPI003EBF4C3D